MATRNIVIDDVKKLDSPFKFVGRKEMISYLAGKQLAELSQNDIIKMLVSGAGGLESESSFDLGNHYASRIFCEKDGNGGALLLKKTCGGMVPDYLGEDMGRGMSLETRATKGEDRGRSVFPDDCWLIGVVRGPNAGVEIFDFLHFGNMRYWCGGCEKCGKEVRNRLAGMVTFDMEAVFEDFLLAKHAAESIREDLCVAQKLIKELAGPFTNTEEMVNLIRKHSDLLRLIDYPTCHYDYKHLKELTEAALARVKNNLLQLPKLRNPDDSIFEVVVTGNYHNTVKITEYYVSKDNCWDGLKKLVESKSGCKIVNWRYTQVALKVD